MVHKQAVDKSMVYKKYTYICMEVIDGIVIL